MKVRFARDKGFTLIEMAIVMIIIGAILTAVLKGESLIENAKAKRVVAQVVELESLTWGFYDRYGRFPGDCPTNARDGIIDIPASRNWDVEDLDTSNTPPDGFCDGDDDVNKPLNDLKFGGLYDSNIPNRELFGTEFRGTIGLAYVSFGTNEPRNVIFVNDIPCWLAQEIDVNFDRYDSPGAGKVRYYTGYTSVETDTNKSWSDICPEGVDKTVGIVYLFERGYTSSASSPI